MKAFFEVACPDVFVKWPVANNPFLTPPPKKTSTLDNLKNIFSKQVPEKQEVTPLPDVFSFSAWDLVVEKVKAVEYQQNPARYIQSKHIETYHRCSGGLIGLDIKALKIALTFNERCRLVKEIHGRIRKFQGVEVVSESIKTALNLSVSDMRKTHLAAVIEPLLAYYGIEQHPRYTDRKSSDGTSLLSYPFCFGTWITIDINSQFLVRRLQAFACGYRLKQMTVYRLEDEIINDLKNIGISKGNHMKIPPRVIQSREFELPLFHIQTSLLFDELHLLAILYQFYDEY